MRGVHLIQAAYLVFILVFLLYVGIGLTPDVLFLLLAFAFALRGSRRAFVRDFAPFILLLLSYDAMRGIADDLGGRVHITYPIDADRALFSEVPTLVLQRWLHDPGVSHWYDYAAVMVYVLHFVVPLIFAALFWQQNRSVYWRLVLSLVVMSYAGFITQILIPTAPPWYAGETGDLPGVGLPHEAMPRLNAVWLFLSANEVAAMPSLHAAYPWLLLLFCVRVWGVKGAAFSLYVAGVFFSIVYLGHHYVVDILAGLGYATVAYVCCATDVVPNLVRALRRLVAPVEAPDDFTLEPVPEREAA